MNSKYNNRIRISKLLFLELVGIAALVFLVVCPRGLDKQLESCYYHICVQWFIMILAWLSVLDEAIDILEPIVLFSVIHFIFFEVTPLICIINGNILFFGIDVWGGCIKGTYISTVGYILAITSYSFLKEGETDNVTEVANRDVVNHDIENAKAVLTFNYIVWMISFICGLLLIYGYGLNFTYLVTGGLSHLSESTNEKSAFGFLGIFFYCMIPSYLYIYELENSRVIKTLVFYLTFMSYYVRGFRFIMIACILAPMVYSYLKRRRRPGIASILAIVTLFVMLTSFVQYTRTSLRSGMGAVTVISDILSFESISNVIIGNFEIVKTYYAIVANYPRYFNYTLGAEIFLSTALLLIPSAIWHGKPSPPIYRVVENSLTEYARRAGTSFPYLGEYYFEFGILGVCFFMILLGCLLKKLKVFMYSTSIHDLILYSSVYPLLFQVLIRGYTPTNFYMIVFVILPTLLSKALISSNKQSNWDLNVQ